MNEKLKEKYQRFLEWQQQPHQVKPLSEEERPAELARIMGSVNDPLAIQHAKNLLRSAREG